MKSRRLEVADVIRQHAEEFLEKYAAATSSRQRRVLRALASCRTRSLGGHIEACDRCGHRRIAYNSCRDRHCPKCQGPARAKWLAARAAELLPVPHFHVVFTLPDSIGPVALQNPRAVYRVLFEAASRSLIEIAANPKHLGAQIGILAVLHTWGQNLHLHPHVHCIVTGGGISPDGMRWVASRKRFFLPVRVVSRLFRGKFLALFRRAVEREEIGFHGGVEHLRDAKSLDAWTARLRRKEWVVYAKPPFGGPERVLRYLARYTHRVAISNERLMELQSGTVTFRWKDYADGDRDKRMTLSAVEFLRRFLQHVLPKGFVKIRHYGLLANRHRAAKLAQATALLAASGARQPVPPPSPSIQPYVPALPSAKCPVCGQGTMLLIEVIVPATRSRGAGTALAPWDTS